MSILVVGSIALDTVETQRGKVQDSPGGSALYFSSAASFFAPVNVVGVVGEDFDFNLVSFFKDKKIDLSGVKVEKGHTFRWGGRYEGNMNHRDTLFTSLNVFESFRPEIPENYRDSQFVFLANIDPELQLQVLQSVTDPVLTVLDTMNFWISGKRQVLDEVIRQVDVLIVNDEELRELTGIYPLNDAGRALLDQGLRALIIKKGENGAVLMSGNDYFSAPAFPVTALVDPTGAGDSFAGGFLGYLASCPRLTDKAFRTAVAYGSVVASFNVESFSFEKLKEITRSDIEKRLTHFRKMTRF